MPSWTTERARIAGLRRQGRSEDDPAVVEARRDLRAARLIDHVSQVVAERPALTEGQKARILALLTPCDAIS